MIIFGAQFAEYGRPWEDLPGGLKICHYYYYYYYYYYQP